jgi:hypothetical protein
MKSPKIVARFLLVRVSVFVLTCPLGTSVTAAPVALPEWIKPMERTLPGIPPEVVSEVDEIYNFTLTNRENGYSSEVKAQHLFNSKRLVELQEQADLARIWQYLKATDGSYGTCHILSSLGCDRGLAAWLLPIVRYRIEWLKNALTDPRQKKYIHEFFAGSELYDIQNYFFKQGEFSDIENLNLLASEATKLGFGGGLKNLGTYRSLQNQVKDMQEARNKSEQQTGPYWQWGARHLIKEGVLTADALKSKPSAQNPIDDSIRPKPLGPRQPLPEIKDPDDYPEPWMVWQIWLFLGVVSAALFLWLCRRPKRAPTGVEPVGAGRGL